MKRRKHSKQSVIRSPGHLTWVRGHACAVPGCVSPLIEAAHVRHGTDGGTAMKPGDNWAIPLCSHHHAEQHRRGGNLFDKDHGINSKDIAAALWQKSPHRI